MTENSLAVFEDYKIRRVFDEESETWYFSVVDIIQVLIQQPNYQTARKYWNKLKERLKKDGSQSVTNCHQLKMEVADGKQYLTDVADPETLLRLIQSVPSPRAEPIKLWLAKVGYERIQDMADPARSLDRAREYWQQHKRSEKWIQQRMQFALSPNSLILVSHTLSGAIVNWRSIRKNQTLPRRASRSFPVLMASTKGARPFRGEG